MWRFCDTADFPTVVAAHPALTGHVLPNGRSRTEPGQAACPGRPDAADRDREDPSDLPVAELPLAREQSEQPSLRRRKGGEPLSHGLGQLTAQQVGVERVAFLGTVLLHGLVECADE